MEMIPPGTLEALGLYVARTSALVAAAPLLGTGTGFVTWRIGLIVAGSFLLYSVSGAPLPTSPAPIEYGALVLRDYYIAATPEGSLVWVFRHRLPGQAGPWFLHGRFG